MKTGHHPHHHKLESTRLLRYFGFPRPMNAFGSTDTASKVETFLGFLRFTKKLIRWPTREPG